MLKNSSKSYGWISIVIHWLMAIAIFYVFGLGLYMVELTYYDTWYVGSLDLHRSLGMVLFGFLIFRFIWRVVNTQPEALAGPKWQQQMAHWMHQSLYIVMLLLMVSGYLISTADGKAIVIFDLLSVPALPWQIVNQEDITGDIHEVLSWLLIVLSAVHALAALKHHFINKDGGLSRMFKVDKID